MTLYGQHEIGHTAGTAMTAINMIVPETRADHFGENAVKAATEAPEKLVSEIGPDQIVGDMAQGPPDCAEKLDLHMWTVERVNMILEVALEVQDAWVALRTATAQGGPVVGQLIGPSFPDVPRAPSTETRQLLIGFAKSLDGLVRKHRPFLKALFNGPWV